MAAPNRSKSGAPTAAARAKFGMKDGSFPVFDEKSAKDAINLRGQGNKSAVLSHVNKWATANSHAGVQAAVKSARAEDRAVK